MADAGFVAYVNRRVNHAMIHYADRWHVRVRHHRGSKGWADDEGWPDVFETYSEAEDYAVRQVPEKKDTRLCKRCEAW